MAKWWLGPTTSNQCGQNSVCGADKHTLTSAMCSAHSTFIVHWRQVIARYWSPTVACDVVDPTRIRAHIEVVGVLRTELHAESSSRAERLTQWRPEQYTKNTVKSV